MNHKNVAVFCGSSLGTDPIYEEKAEELGSMLSDKECNLVYGGGNRGIMGVFAKIMKNAGSRVIGVSPKRFEKSNTEHPMEIDEYYVVDTMQERKACMYEKADAFIVFPGGTGTLDEMAEIITLKNLGFHGKPIVILNLNGFYNGLKDLLDSMAKAGFWEDKGNFAIVDTVDQVISYLENTETYKGKYEA